jgi:hypothetical protein
MTLSITPVNVTRHYTYQCHSSLHPSMSLNIMSIKITQGYTHHCHSHYTHKCHSILRPSRSLRVTPVNVTQHYTHQYHKELHPNNLLNTLHSVTCAQHFHNTFLSRHFRVRSSLIEFSQIFFTDHSILHFYSVFSLCLLTRHFH